MTKKESNKVITIANTRFIFILTKKFITGLSRMAIRIAKMMGTTMLWAMYNIANKTNMPIKKMVTLA
jgi:hypothetical protein